MSKPDITDSIANFLLQDHVELMRENAALREAAEMALQALERSLEAGVTGIKVDEAITSLRQALNVDAVNISKERVDETAEHKHEGKTNER